jgi:hypothetical protein
MPERFASPTAAALAAELGLEGVGIVGTGKDGAVTAADVRAAAPPGPPPGLDEAGQLLWREVRGRWDLRPDEDRLLAAACSTLDEIGRLEEALVDADLVVEGSKGQTRPHPLIAEVRAHRLALRQLLGSLGIEEAEGEAGTDHGEARSSAGRKLAGIRWGQRRG